MTLRIGLFFCALCFSAVLIAAPKDSVYQDLSHYSTVFGHKKLFRLYLPKRYDKTTKRYPVIYFFHGWGGRPWKDDNAKLDYTRLGELVNKYQVILVMWDGNIDGIEQRPYNVGNHEDVKFTVQMKDYFPELVGHIDSSYRTLTDRAHRGIIGFSMGGFMSLYLAGKYPDKVSAAVSLAGSPEFFVGYPESHVLYPVRYTFENLRDVAVRQHNGNTDILYYLNSEVRAGAVWDEQVHHTYWTFDGGHMVDKAGEIKVFDSAVRFVTTAFAQAAASVRTAANGPAIVARDGLHPASRRWSHYDLYPSFDLWDYKVTSDKREAGYLYLKHVDSTGFGFYTKRWLPDGPTLGPTQVTVLTAPVYKPRTNYGVARYSFSTGKVSSTTACSNSLGRIPVKWDAEGGEAGIYSEKDDPVFVVLDSHADSSRLLSAGKDHLALRLFNRGGAVRSPLTITVHVRTADTGIRLIDSVVSVIVAPGQRVVSLPALGLVCGKVPPAHFEPSEIRFHVQVDGSPEDECIVPVFFNAPLFDSVRTAEAGQKLSLAIKGHRLRLYTNDPYVLSSEERLEDEMIPAIWPDGYTFSSVIQVSPDCPDGHVIELLGHYETKTYNPIERKLYWNRIRVVVQNRPAARRIGMDEFFGVNVGGCAAAPADIAKVSGWVRDYSQWKWLQPERHQYTFSNAAGGKMNYDAYYRQLDSLHIHSLFVVQQTPWWLSSGFAMHDKDSNTYAPCGDSSGLIPEHYREAASFFYQLAARYGKQKPGNILTRDGLSGLGLMDALEVFNEPDATWGNHTSLEQYAAFLNAVYDGNGGKMKGPLGIKVADPSMPVSIGGLADNLVSLKKIVAYAGRAPFDIINAHYYTFWNVREKATIYAAPEWSSLMADMSELVQWSRVHAPGRPVWLTEIGFDTKRYVSQNVTEQEAADYLIRSYLLALGCGIEKVFWFIWNDLDNTENPGVFASSGLFENDTVRYSGTTALKPKLTYWYNATFKHLLAGYYYDKNLSFPLGDSTVYEYRFVSKDGRRQLSVVWYCPLYRWEFRPTSGSPWDIRYQWSLPVGSRLIKVVKPVAGSFEGAVPAYQSDGGRISLKLDGTPVLIESEIK